MSRLPDRFRELLVLRELKGLSYRELADVMGIPIGTVMSGLSRARQAFRERTERRDSKRSRECTASQTAGEAIAIPARSRHDSI